MSKQNVSPLDMAHFKFGLISPVIQNRFPDASAMAYYRRVTAEPIERPDGTFYKYNPGTLQKWVVYYNAYFMAFLNRMKIILFKKATNSS